MAKRDTNRPRKVGDLIHQTLAQMLQREVKDPRVIGVNITDVEVSGDLAHAKVYYSVMDITKAQQAQEGLTKAKGFLKRLIGQHCDLRIVPQLHFQFDDTAQKASEIERLIQIALHGKK
jgi:ribosome-binding factor A